MCSRVVLGPRRQLHRRAQRLELARRGWRLKNASAAGRVDQPELLQRGLGVLVDQVAHRALLRAAGAVLDDRRPRTTTRSRSARTSAVVVVVEQRARQRVDGLAPQVVRLVDHVLLLERADREPHRLVVHAGLCACSARVSSLSHARRRSTAAMRGLLRGALLDQRHLGGELRACCGRQLLQRRQPAPAGARPRARRAMRASCCLVALDVLRAPRTTTVSTASSTSTLS